MRAVQLLEPFRLQCTGQAASRPARQDDKLVSQEDGPEAEARPRPGAGTELGLPAVGVHWGEQTHLMARWSEYLCAQALRTALDVQALFQAD